MQIRIVHALALTLRFRRFYRGGCFFLQALIILLCLLGIEGFIVPTSASPLTDDGEWKTRLFAQASTTEAAEYARAHPDEAFAIFRDGMAVAKPEYSSNLLWTLVNTGNPYTLDALDLAMNASDDTIQHTAVSLLESIAFEKFPRKNAPAADAHFVAEPVSDGGKAYAAWKRLVAGKSPEEAIRLGETALLRVMAQSSDPGERSRCLVRLLAADFRLDTPLGRLRRKIAGEGNVLAVLETLSVPPHRADAYTLYGLRLFEADEARLRRVVLPYALQENDAGLRSEALTTLAARKSPKATEIITWLLTTGYNGDLATLLFDPLAAVSDPRLIPVCIGALAANPTGMLASELDLALSDLTGFRPSAKMDAAAWEQWWQQNRRRYPESVRKLPIPRLKPQSSLQNSRKKLT